MKVDSSSLFFQFNRLKIVTVCVIGLGVIESFVVLYLLASTQLRCNFSTFYQSTVITVTTALNMCVQLIAGSLTDRLAYYNHYLLQIFSVIGTILDAILFLFGDKSEILILCVYAIRGMMITQLNFTIFKILKLRIENVLKYPTEQQFKIFSHFVMFSQVIAYVFTTIGGFAIPSIYIHFFGGSYFKIKYILTAMMMSLDCVCLGVSFFIPQSYYVSKEMLEGKIQIIQDQEEQHNDTEENHIHLDSDGTNIDDGDDDDDIAMHVNHPDVLTEEIDGNSLGDSISHKTGSPSQVSSPSEKANLIPLQDDMSEEEDDANYATYQGYLRFGCYKYWTTPILWGMMVKYCLFYVSSAMLQVVLIFQLSAENTILYPTLGNLCSGFLTNYIDIKLVTFSIAIGGNILFQLVIQHMRPYYYLSIIQNILIGLIIVLLIPLFFPLNTWANGILFALINVLQYIVGSFDNNVLNSITPNQIMGLSFAYSGVLPPLFAFSAVGLAVMQLSTFWNVTVIMAFHFIYLVYAIGYGNLQSRNIKKKLDDVDRFSSNSFYQTWVLGYGQDWLAKKEV